MINHIIQVKNLDFILIVNNHTAKDNIAKQAACQTTQRLDIEATDFAANVKEDINYPKKFSNVLVSQE